MEMEYCQEVLELFFNDRLVDVSNFIGFGSSSMPNHGILFSFYCANDFQLIFNNYYQQINTNAHDDIIFCNSASLLSKRIAHLYLFVDYNTKSIYLITL